MNMTTDTTQAFDFEEYLKSDELALWRNVYIHRTIIWRVTGSLSTIASACIIVHILRSHHGLSTTYHRLVFGLSLGDFFFSFFSSVLDSVMAPQEYDYIVPFAMGNQASCDAQGFLVTFFSGLTLAYNTSLCFYYLAIITFDKNDDFIRNKLEPWIHVISIFPLLCITSIMLAINGYNSSEGTCWFTPNDLPHCRGLDKGEIRNGFTIPCGRGGGEENPALYRIMVVVHLLYPVLVPVVIVVTMTLMFRSVQKVEKKMRQYGVSALRLRKSTSLVSGTTSRSSQRSSTRSSRLRSNTVASQKRAILRRATGYVGAWALSWIPFLIWSWSDTFPVTTTYIYATLFPLQGVLNFVVFMHPKVMSAKKGHKRRRFSLAKSIKVEEVSWGRAFVKAYTSRGEKKRTGLRHSQYHRKSRVSWRDSLLPNTLSKLKLSGTSFLSRGSMKNSIRRNAKEGMASKEQQEMQPFPNPIESGGVIAVGNVAFPGESFKGSILRNTEEGILIIKQEQEMRPFPKPLESEDIITGGDVPYTNENAETEPAALQVKSNSRYPLVLAQDDDQREDGGEEVEDFLFHSNGDEVTNKFENDEVSQDDDSNREDGDEEIEVEEFLLNSSSKDEMDNILENDEVYFGEEIQSSLG